METARSSYRLCTAHRGSVDQRSARLCLSAAGHRDNRCGHRLVEGACASHSEAARDLARVVAMDHITGNFSRLGRGRYLVSARVLPGSCDAGICRPLWRNNSSVATVLFLFPASLAQICAVEPADDRACAYRSTLAKLAFARGFSRNVGRNVLAGLLEHWRADCDVAGPIKARRQNFSGDSAAMFA